MDKVQVIQREVTAGKQSKLLPLQLLWISYIALEVYKDVLGVELCISDVLGYTNFKKLGLQISGDEVIPLVANPRFSAFFPTDRQPGTGYAEKG